MSLSTFPEKRILVVEDYEINREVIQGILELMHCQVDTAENGQQALELVANNTYDLIFMDMQMPIIDGLTATKTIREQEDENTRTPIVALTANALSEDRDKCLNSGMDDYLPKPIEISNVESLLKKFFNPK